MSADEDIPPEDDGSAPPPEGGAPATPAEADPFAALKEADRAAEEAAAAAPPEPETPAEEDPFAALKAADQAAEEAAAAPAEPESAESAVESEASADPIEDDATAAEPAPEEAPPAEAPAASVFRYDEKFYEPASADSPTGAAIEFYHFADMDQELAWPQNEFGRPDPGQRPNFRAVKDAALGFLTGTKEFKATRDVRPLLGLVIAEAGDKGPVGLATSLDLFVETATTHWDAIYPQKEDADDDELMTRMEEMRRYMNPQVISMAVESVGIARSPRVGDLTTRTFGIAATKVVARDGEFAPNSEALLALLGEEEDVNAKVVEAHDAYRHAIDRLRAMEAFLEEHPDVDPVDLNSVATVLETQVSYLAPYVAVAGDGGDSGSSEGEGGDLPVSSGSLSTIAGPDTIEETMALLDEILVFYARSGRSSPVPLGLIALRDLISSDFNTWLNQTASMGLAEAAINLSAVDASRLAGFASGEIPSAGPAPKAEIDFSGIDPKLYDLEGAYATIDNAIYTVQQRLIILEAQAAEAAGEEAPDSEAEAPLAAEMVGLRAAVDGLQEARLAMESGAPASGGEPNSSGSPNNAAEGDMHHSRITDRSGVKMALDAVAAYFEREEPSSPAPAYLKRLKGLVDARFTEIARELMPEEGGEAKLRLEPRTKLR